MQKTSKQPSFLELKAIFQHFLAVTLICLLAFGPLPIYESQSKSLGFESAALAQGFSSLLNPDQVSNFSELCYDYESVSKIILLFNKTVTVFAATSPAGQVTGALMAAAENANTITDICTIVIAVGTAKDMKSVLRATKTINRIHNLGWEAGLEQFEDTMSFYDFANDLKNSKQSNKRKLLNVNNYKRTLDFAFQTLPLDGIDAQIIAKKKAKEEDRAAKIADLSQQVYGCRVPIKKLADGEVKLADGNVKVAVVDKWAVEMNKQAELQNAAANFIPQIFANLRKMVAEVSTTPEETSAALAILQAYIRDGLFVSVGYAPPTDKTLTKGEIVQVENKYAKYQPADSPEEGIQAVEKRKAFIQKQDGSTEFYRNQGSFIPNQCDDKNTKLERWVILNADVLSDQYIKGQSIVDKLRICPPANGIGYLSRFQISKLVVPVPSAEREKKINKAVEAVEDNCKKRSINELFSDLEEVKSLSNGMRNSGLRKPKDKCKLSQAEVDNISPPSYNEIEGVENMADWLKYYNNLFNSYTKMEYKLALAENPAADSMREWAGNLSTVMRGGDLSNKTRGGDGSYGSKSGWDPDAGNKMNPEQSRFLSNWKRPEIFCTLPKTLARRYKGTESEKIIATASTHQAEYYQVIQDCINKQRQASSNDDTFKETFLAMIDAIEELNNAKLEIFTIDLLSGAYKGEAGRKPQGCLEEIKPADVSLANARSAVAALESMEALNKALDELLVVEHKRDAETQKRAEDAEIRNLQAIGNLRKADAILSQDNTDLNDNPSYDYSNAFPSFIESRKQINEMGGDPSQLNK